MNKSGLALTIRVLYFALALPLAEQKHFASGVRGNLQHLIYMLFFHHQNQVRPVDQFRFTASSASDARPAEAVSMPGQLAKTCSAVGDRRRLREQTNRTFRGAVLSCDSPR